jgi:hypothetical protein
MGKETVATSLPLIIGGQKLVEKRLAYSKYERNHDGKNKSLNYIASSSQMLILKQ